MVIEDIRSAFRESVCGEIDIASGGVNRYVVHVPFTFGDGDHYVVLLKQEQQQWMLSDEGHTFMHLSYDLTDFQFDQGTRRSIIDEVLNNLGIEDRDGELVMPVPGKRYGDALFSFIQAITKITDVTFLSRDRVRSTFLEDFRTLVEEKSKAVGLTDVQFDYTHPNQDPRMQYKVDVRINSRFTPQLLLFGIGNDAQCRDATITLLQWEKWQEKFQSIAVFRDQTEINRLVLARFSNVTGRQLTSLEVARERLADYFREALPR